MTIEFDYPARCKQANINKVLKIPKENSEEDLNTEFPHETIALEEITANISENYIKPSNSKVEVSKTSKCLKNWKSTGFSNITEETITAGGKYMVNTLHEVFNKILSE